MQSKSTLIGIDKLSRYAFMIFVLIFLGTSIHAQTYVNGNLSTGATTLSGVAAPTGYTWSEVQNVAGITDVSNSVTGFAGSDAATSTLADDFTVPAGQSWTLSKLTFYVYRTGAPATPSPINGLRVQIHKGNPALGPTTIVFGDLTTNRLTASNDALMYRIANTIAPPPGTPSGTTRKVWTAEANVSVTLGEGTYWLEWQTTAPAAAAHFSPPSTVVGVRTVAGYNAMQKNTTTNVWTVLLDGGNPATPPSVNVDMPFRVDYTAAAACTGTPAPGNTLSTSATVCSGISFNLSLQNNIPGSGISYQWQSSTDGVTYTNIPGATAASLSTSLTASTFYQAIVTCSGNSATSTPVQVLLQAPVITAQPANASSTCSGSATFTATTTGIVPIYQWQQRTSAAAPWTDVVNGLDAGTGAIFNTAQTNTLSIQKIAASMNGYQYRVSLAAGCAVNSFSDPATLTVTPLVVVVNPATAAACGSSTTPIGMAITNTTTSLSAPITTSFASGTLNTTIPENQVGIINAIPVSVPAGAIISAASVTLNINHTWVGDLVIALKAPNGNVLNLDYALHSTGGAAATTGFVNTVISSTGTTTLDLGTDPWTGIFAPDAPATLVTGLPSSPTALSAANANVFNFGGLYSVPSGDWTIGIFDLATPDIGTLVNWTLSLTYTVPVTAPLTGVWTPATGLFTNSAATTAYVAGSQEDSVWLVPSTSTNYTVTVTSAACPTPPVVVPVTINQPVTTVTSPLDATICSNTNTTFTVTPQAGNPLTYQWQVSTDAGATFNNVADGGIYTGATTNTLNLSNVPSANNGYQYQAIVSVAGCGSVTSNAATLTVNGAASVTTQPSSVTVCDGSDAVFTVVAGGASVTYQWQQSTDGGTTFTPISGATSATLTVPAVTPAMNNYQYNVIISNACTPAGVTSANATLTVSNVATITAQPVDVTVCEGANTSFTVTASATSYQWQVSTDGGTNFTDITGETNTTLNLSAVTAGMNNNQYRLVAFSCGPTGLNSTAAILTVNSGVSITTQPADVTACVGSDATFTITAAGTAPITYQWEASADGGVTFTPIPGAVTNSITIPAVTLAMSGGIVHVVMTNGCTATITSASAQLTVEDLPVITVQPSSTSACEGTTASFSVTATGSGLTYQWQVSTDGGATFNDIGSQTGSTLDLTAVPASSNNNQYQVLVFSSCSATGNPSDPATLTVNAAPVITISASPYTSLTSGLTTTITATSTPAGTYSWHLNGNLISATGSSIPVTHAELGVYTASVTDANGCSATSNAITITDSTVSNSFLYPNPNRGVFYLSFNDGIDGISRTRNVAAYDVKGARVYTKQFTYFSVTHKEQIDMSRMPKGVYLLNITDVAGDLIRTEKVVIE